MEALLRLALRHWKTFFTTALCGAMAAWVIFFFFNTVEGESQIVAAAMAHGGSVSELPWDPPAPTTDAENSGQVKNDLKDLGLWLKSYDFMAQFLASHCPAGSRKSYCAEINDDDEKAVLRFMGKVDSQLDDGKILKVRARTHSAVFSTSLANALALDLVSLDHQQSLAQATRLQTEMKNQRALIEARLATTMKTLTKSSRGGPTLSNTDQNLVYLSQMQEKIAILDLEISENKRVVNLVKAHIPANASEDYGPSLKVKELENENKILIERRKSVASQLQNSLSAQYFSASGPDSMTQLKEQMRVDLDNYAGLTKALEKINLATTLQSKHFELFQKANALMAHPRFPLLLLLAIGIFLSQVVTTAMFLLAGLWKEEKQSQEQVQNRTAFADPFSDQFDPHFASSPLEQGFRNVAREIEKASHSIASSEILTGEAPVQLNLADLMSHSAPLTAPASPKKPKFVLKSADFL